MAFCPSVIILAIKLEIFKIEYEKANVEVMTLALLFLNAWIEKYGPRAWKNFNWQTRNRLNKKGFIDN